MSRADIMFERDAPEAARPLAARLGGASQGEKTMEANRTEVTVVDIRMPFWSMVVFMVKWAIASIPAIIILVVIGAMIAGFMGGLLGGLHHLPA